MLTVLSHAMVSVEEFEYNDAPSTTPTEPITTRGQVTRGQSASSISILQSPLPSLSFPY
jgi:hypothetical protein